ncbi:MAG: ImmA/IrrE family metallo-endopeptidase [Planctomycetota bacterium]
MAVSHDNSLHEDIAQHYAAATIDGVADAVASATLSAFQDDAGSDRVDLERLAERLGVIDISYDDLPCDAMLSPVDEDRYSIKINMNSARRRARFSLAHELAHILIHCAVPDTKSIAHRSLFLQPGNRAEETLCDQIAAALLMPRQSFSCAVVGQQLTVGLIHELARRFDVSIAACSRRLAELSRVDFAVALVRKQSDTASPQIARVLSDFRRDRLGRIHAMSWNSYGAVAIAIERGISVCDWDWLRQANIRRKLFVSTAVPVYSDGRGVMAILSRRNEQMFRFMSQGMQMTPGGRR